MLLAQRRSRSGEGRSRTFRNNELVVAGFPQAKALAHAQEEGAGVAGVVQVGDKVRLIP